MRAKGSQHTPGSTSSKASHRQLTRKLKQIIQQLKAKPEADAFIEPVDESKITDYSDYVSDPIDLSTIESKLTQYGSAEELLADVQLMHQNCVEYNGKTSELSRACRVLVDLCAQLIAEDEADEAATDTASSTTVAAPPVTPNAKSSTTLNAASKAKLKQIVQSLIDDPRAEPFIHPIQESDVPGYFDIIENPMDLSTIKTKCRAYKQVDEFIADVRLVWDNCRTFNEDGAAISSLASELEHTSWELVLKHFPSAVVPQPVEKAGRSKSRGSSRKTSLKQLVPEPEPEPEPEPVVLKLKRGWKPQIQHDDSADDSDIVSLSDDHLVEPLHQAKRGRKSKSPDKPLAGSELTPEDEPPKVPRGRKPKIAAAEQVVADDHPASSAPRRGRKPKSMQVTESASIPMEVAAGNVGDDEELPTEDLRSRRKRSIRFTANGITHVDSDSEIEAIDSPDDESTHPQEKRIKAGESEDDATGQPVKGRRKKKDSLEETATGPTKSPGRRSSIPKVLKQLLEAMKNDPHSGPFMQPVAESEAPGYHELIDHPNDLTTMTKNLPRYGADVNAFKEDMQLIWDNCMTYNSPDSIIWSWAKELSEKFESLFEASFGDDIPQEEDNLKIRQLYEELRSHELAGPFLEPVDESIAPGYSALITQPIDLSTIAQHITNYGADFNAFAQDVQLMFDNCRKYNLPDSAIYKVADKLSAWFSKKFAKVFSGSAKPKSTKKAEKQGTKQGGELTLQMSKANKRFGSLDRELSELEKTELLISGTDGIFAYPVKKTAHQQSQAFLKKLQFPWQFEGFRVNKLGKVRTAADFHNRSYIFPVNYEAEKDLHIRITSQNGTKLVPLTFTSTITESSNKPSFVVTVDNVLVSASGHPVKVWEHVLQSKSAILMAAGARLRRCRALLNRFVIDPHITPFLEEIKAAGAAAYYNAIKSPIWLREIHARFVRGDYDTEYEFADDVRLMWENCKSYNKAGSELWELANKFEADFDSLFCDWILNVRDRSITDLARGPWDQWVYLRYFDGVPEDIDMCRITGQHFPESDLLFCSSCEDQYHPDALDLPHADTQRTDWKCERCIIAESDEDRVPSDPGYVEETRWSPCAEVGSGWMKSADNLAWLSPFGHQVTSNAELSRTIPFCQEIHDTRKQERESQFQETKQRRRRKSENPDVATTDDVSSNGESRSRRNSRWRIEQNAVQQITPTTTSISINRDKNAPTVIKRSLLSTLRIGAHDTVEIVCDVGFEGVESWAVTPELLPECGFFGLESDDIRRAIEGLDKAVNCEKYEFEAASDIRDQLLEEVESAKERQRILAVGNRGLLDSLASERWQFQRQAEVARKRLCQVSSAGAQPRGLLIPAHKLSLFAGLRSEEIESILMIWEFLNTARELLGDVKLSLQEIAVGVTFQATRDSAGLELPSLEQLYYDELSVCLTKLLLMELRNVTSLRTDKDWTQLLALKPLNILTWPEIAKQCLCILAQYRMNELYNSSDVIRSLRTCLSPTLQPCEDIVCLLMTHPLIKPFMEPVDPLLAPGYHDIIKQPMDLNTIRRRLATYDSTEQFAADVRLIWQNALQFNEPMGEIAAAARLLSKYFERLWKKWIGHTAPQAAQVVYDPRVIHPAFWGQDLTGSPVENIDNTVESDPTYSNPALTGYPVPLDQSELCSEGHARELEAVIETLRSTDPEYWPKKYRLQTLELLVQECTQTNIFRHFLSKSNPGLDADDTTPDISEQLPEVAGTGELEPVRKNAQSTCFVSGLQAKDVPDERWVSVPEEYLMTPTSTDQTQQLPAIDPQSKHSHVALEHCMKKVMSARKLAINEANIASELRNEKVARWEGRETDPDNNHSADALADLALRTQPLGHDRSGNEYWCFGAMRTGLTAAMGLQVQGERDPPVPRSLQDGILVRETTGRWKYYRGKADILMLVNVLDSQFGCDQLLRARIIDDVTLTVRSSNDASSPWVKNRRIQHDWVKFYTTDVLHCMGTVDAVKFIETLWARCVETRISVHCLTAQPSIPDMNPKKDPSVENAREINKEKKRAKEQLIEQTMDFHPVDGWLRVGPFESIKELSASTTASKLLTDAAVAAVTSQLLSRSKLRKAGSLGSTMSLDNDGEPDAAVVRETPSVRKPKRELKEVDGEEDAGDDDGTKGRTSNRAIPVDQIDPSTGRVIKRWMSGRDAATILEISQGGISLCCKGTKPEAYGFAWRFAKDTPETADIQEIDIEVIKTMLDRRRGARNKSSSSHVEAVDGEGRDDAATPMAEFEGLAKVPDNNVTKPQLSVSVVLVSPRLAKLKAELLNMAAIIPTHKFIWDPNHSLSISRDNSELELQSLANYVQWVVNVQQATTPQLLLELMIAFESAVPKDYVHSYYLAKAFPLETATCAGVAWRLYAFDRALRYEDAAKFDWRASTTPYRPRIELYSRCVVSPQCSKPLCHWGRCNSANDGMSRLPELVIPPITPWFINNKRPSMSDQAANSLIVPGAMDALMVIFPETKRKKQAPAPKRPASPPPMLPDPSEIKESAWI